MTYMARSDKPRGKNERRKDIEDPVRDQDKLKGDEATINLPDVKDIPGQEYVHAPNPGEFADSTISSADEEADELWSDARTSEPGGSDVSPLERKLLDESANDMPTTADRQLRRAELDDQDNDGEPLNERTSASAISGSDLDVPGAGQDDANEAIGEEDEENNPYSLGGDDEWVNEERTD